MGAHGQEGRHEQEKDEQNGLAIRSDSRQEQRRRDGEDTTYERAYLGNESRACGPDLWPYVGSRCGGDLGIYS